MDNYETGIYTDNPDDTLRYMKSVDRVCLMPEKHKTAEWKTWYHGGANFTYSCSLCGYHPDEKTNYCPRCGAEMGEKGQVQIQSGLWENAILIQIDIFADFAILK